MAPEPEVLKRARSAPRSWWAVTPTTSPPATTAVQSPHQHKPVRVRVRKPTVAHKSGTIPKPKESLPAVDQSKFSQNAPTAPQTKSIDPRNHGHDPQAADAPGRRLSGRIRDRPSDYWAVTSLSKKSNSQNFETAVSRRSAETARDTAEIARKHETNADAKPSASTGTARASNVDKAKNNKSRSRQDVAKYKKNASNHSPGAAASGVVESPEQDELIAVETATSSFSRTKPGQQSRVATSQSRPAKRSAKTTKNKQGTREERVDQHTVRKRASETFKRATLENMGNKRPAVESHQSKRRRIDAADEESPIEPEPRLKFPRLKPGTRQVSRNTIDSKWEVLPHESIERISQMLHGAERPVLIHSQDERRRSLVSSAISMVSGRLIRKIGKGMPFPSRTQGQAEDDFDFEGILNTQTLLYSKLTPAIHTNALLEAELKQRKNKLESEKADLSELDANAKSEASKRKQDNRKLHQLIQYEDKSKEDLVDDLGIQIDTEPYLAPLQASKNVELLSLVQKVNDHVRSMQGNISQIQGIGQALAKGKAAVQATFLEQLSHEHYEQAVLG